MERFRDDNEPRELTPLEVSERLGESAMGLINMLPENEDEALGATLEIELDLIEKAKAKLSKKGLIKEEE